MKRMTAPDSFKAIAAFMVIFIHVTAAPVTTLTSGCSYDLLLLVNRFSKPSVPMFLFVSGLVLQRSYQNRAFRYGEFLQRRVQKVLIPYVIWCAIYYAWFIFHGIYEFDSGFFAENLLSGKMMYHLYFVVVIVQYYVLFAFFRWITEKYPAHFVLPVAALLNLIEICIISEQYYGRCFITYLTVFFMGCYIAKHYEKAMEMLLKLKSILFLAAGFFGFGILYTLQFAREMSCEHGIFDDDRIVFLLFSMFASLLIYSLCVLLAKKADGGCSFSGRLEYVLCSIGKASFYIYLAHPFLMLIAQEAALALGETGVVREMLLMLALIFFICIPGALVYANLKEHRHTIKER